MVPAYCFPLVLSFILFFCIELVGGIKNKLKFIEQLLCVGVSNPVSAVGYIVGGCITFSWQLHIVLWFNADFVAYPL